MSDPSIWKDAYQDVLAEGRNRLEPPTADEVEALFENRLPPEKAERVRELLAYYPEMARAMIAPFPTDAAGVLTNEELAADLAAIRKRTGAIPAPTPTPVPPPLPFPSRLPAPTPALAAAAALIAVIAIGAVIAVIVKFAPATSGAVTRVVYPTDIPTRGASSHPPIQLTHGHDYRLKLVFTPDRDYGEYRLVFSDLGSTPSRSLWTRDHVHREQPGYYPVRLSTKRLAPGPYELVLYGLDDGDADRLATFSIRVSS